MPLKVIVVGAGLAGLGAAIALSRSGHDVQVIEQSSFLNEVGAALHMPPNATRVLRSWEIDLESLRPVRCHRVDVWDAKGNHLQTQAVTEDLQRSLKISGDWVLTHRVDLHNALRVAAGRESHGRQVDIQLSSRVVSVDSENGVVTLEDGMTYTGDLVLGADGTHSRCVSGVTGENGKKESTGQNCFRFLVPVPKMRANPLTTPLLEKIGLNGAHIFAAEDRRLVAYPCRGGELLNMVGIHPSDPSSEAKDASWLNSGNMDQLLETYNMFSPELQELCRLGEDLKLWSLASRCPPSTFVKGRLALVGDAAHPTLPHQGQGGAQALEDGAALGAIFPQDTTPEQVPQRLELYNEARYDHALTVMMMSKTTNERRGEMLDELRKYVPDAEVPKDMLRFTWVSEPATKAAKLLAAALE